MSTQRLLASLIRNVTVETTYLPPVVINDPFAPGPPNPLLQILKPRITLGVVGRSAPVVIAPYGDPGPSRWPWIQAGLAAGGLMLVGLLVRRMLR